MKKLISCVLALVLMLSLVPSAFAASSPKVQLTTTNIIVNGVPVTEMHFEGDSQPYDVFASRAAGRNIYKEKFHYDFTPNLEVYNIDGSNYFKLRDIAMLLSKTDSRIGVYWTANAANPNGIVEITWGDYEVVGGECQFDGVDKSASAVKTTTKAYFHTVLGTPTYIIELDAYNIGGNNYVQLRDFIENYTTATVDWDGATNSVIITTIEKQGTLEEQRAYREECFRLCNHDDVSDLIISKYNEMLSSGQIRLDMSVSELEQAINNWLDTVPNQGKVYGGFWTPSLYDHVKSVIVDGNALNNNSFHWTRVHLMDYIYAETARDDIKAAGYWDSNYGWAYLMEYYGV